LTNVIVARYRAGLKLFNTIRVVRYIAGLKIFNNIRVVRYWAGLKLFNNIKVVRYRAGHKLFNNVKVVRYRARLKLFNNTKVVRYRIALKSSLLQAPAALSNISRGHYLLTVSSCQQCCGFAPLLARYYAGPKFKARVIFAMHCSWPIILFTNVPVDRFWG
jgi:hypothetical protein